MPLDERPTVYSTDSNFSKRCPRCNQYPCRCPKTIPLPPQQQTAAIHFEKKGRGGKVVSVVRGLQLSPEDLKTLAKDLKRACGTGGTVKAGAIEIQGDQREKIAAKLKELGFKTKYVGG
jgi:translation initiation factor 1